MTAFPKVLSYLIVAYAVFVALWFAAHWAALDRWWPFILLNKVAIHHLAASLPVLLLSFPTRSTRTILLALAPVFVSLFFYYPFLIPKQVDNTSNSDLRVMTYNLWNQNRNVVAITTIVAQVDPDVLALQELVPDVEAELVVRLSAILPHYHVSKKVAGGTTALFSKMKLINLRELDLGIDRPAIVADINVNKNRIRIMGAHLYPSYYAYHDRHWKEIPKAIDQYIRDQHRQVRTLLGIVDPSDSTPVVLACDCNTQRTASSNVLLRSVFQDSAAALGWQRGDAPFKGAQFERDFGHIDYLWYRGAIEPLGLYRVLSTGGSDHNPIFADFRL